MTLVTKSRLVDDLHRAGIASGDDVILHSSLKRTGRTENGAASVVDAFSEAIGPTGNLMTPTFTYCFPAWKTEPFQHHATTSRVGAITEELRKRTDARRSFHPTHSVTVLGSDAAAIIANHMQATPIGRLSPFGRMFDRGARIVMLGTHQDTNSSLHLCEILLGIPYVKVPFNPEFDYDLAWYINTDNQVEYMQIFEVPGCSRGFRKIEPKLLGEGVLRLAKIGEADTQLLNMREMLDCLRPILANDPTIMLCDIENCAICPRRREYMRSK